jgi:hypothetical protein
MTSTTHEPVRRGGDAVLGAAILGISVVGAALIGRALGSDTRAGALGAASALALGTLAMTVWIAGRTPYPRWSVYTAGAILTAITLVMAGWVLPPADWSKSGYSVGWMVPWSLLTLGLTSPRAKQGICSATHPWAGWILVGGSLLMSALVWGAGLLASRI